MKSGSWRIFTAVFAVGALARMSIVLLFSADSDVNSRLPDEVQYWTMAGSWADGAGLRDELGFQATRMPLYPAFLALFTRLSYGPVIALCVQAVIAALACGLTALLAGRLQSSARGDLISGPNAAPAGQRPLLLPALAGLLVALDPFLVYYSRFLLTEGLFTTVLCAFLVAGWEDAQPGARGRLGRWLGSGILISACVYLKPASIVFLACWSGYILLRRRFERAGVGTVAVLWMTLLLALLPWAMRNQRLTGQWTWLTHRGGISLYDGVHPQATGASDLGSIKRMPAVAELNEVQWNAYFKREAYKYLREDRGRLARLALIKLKRTWRPWPNAPGYQNRWIKWVGGSWSLLILCTALLGIGRCRRVRAPWAALLLPALYVTLLHSVFVGSLRYRLPAMPAIAVLAAVGSAIMIAAYRSRRIKSPTPDGTQ